MQNTEDILLHSIKIGLSTTIILRIKVYESNHLSW